MTKDELLAALKEQIILSGESKADSEGRTWYGVLIEGRRSWLTQSMAAEGDPDNVRYEHSF